MGRCVSLVEASHLEMRDREEVLALMEPCCKLPQLWDSNTALNYAPFLLEVCNLLLAASNDKKLTALRHATPTQSKLGGDIFHLPHCTKEAVPPLHPLALHSQLTYHKSLLETPFVSTDNSFLIYFQACLFL